jgi:hypothetical protein
VVDTYRDEATGIMAKNAEGKLASTMRRMSNVSSPVPLRRMCGAIPLTLRRRNGRMAHIQTSFGAV